MLIGFVSDDRYVVVPEVSLLFERNGTHVSTRSLADGSVRVEIEPGDWRVTLNRPGYGAKVVELRIRENHEPVHFRILDDCLLGYAWPKWVRSGEKSEFRVHSVEPGLPHRSPRCPVRSRSEYSS